VPVDDIEALRHGRTLARKALGDRRRGRGRAGIAYGRTKVLRRRIVVERRMVEVALTIELTSTSVAATPGVTMW
jgi:hypothetical protein